MGECVAQFLWMIFLLKDFKLNYKNIKVLIDNISLINLTKNLIYHSRTKHIEVKYHFIRDHVTRWDIVLDYIEIKSNLADIFIKSLPKAEFNTLRQQLGMCLVE